MKSRRGGRYSLRTILQWAAIAATLLVAAFFAFVGYHKAFDPLADLRRYGAWTVWLPVPLGKAVGWSEIACAAALVLGPAAGFKHVGRVAAGVLIINQLCAAAMHAAHAQYAALPQNSLLIVLLILVSRQSSAPVIHPKKESN